MWADIVDGAVVSIHRESNRPAKHPRGVWLRIVSEGEQYNPVTQQRLGPEAIVESDVVRLVYTVSAHPDAIARKQAYLYSAAQSIHDDYVGQLEKGYTKKQRNTFGQQAAEAERYAANPAAKTKMLDGMVRTSGLTKAEIVANIDLKTDMFADTSGELLGRLSAIGQMIWADTVDMIELNRIERNELNIGWE